MNDCLFKIEFNTFIIKLTGYNSKKLLDQKLLHQVTTQCTNNDIRLIFPHFQSSVLLDSFKTRILFFKVAYMLNFSLVFRESNTNTD